MASQILVPLVKQLQTLTLCKLANKRDEEWAVHSLLRYLSNMAVSTQRGSHLGGVT